MCHFSTPKVAGSIRGSAIDFGDACLKVDVGVWYENYETVL